MKSFQDLQDSRRLGNDLLMRREDCRKLNKKILIDLKPS